MVTRYLLNKFLGYHVDYCPVNDLMKYYNAVEDKDVQAMVDTYFKEYDHAPELEKTGTEAYTKVWNSAKAEIALRRILKDTGAKAFTTNFNDLGDFDQIPGLASQRLMEEGYGFGAEGDWKTAALYRTTWFMSQGMPKGCSFLEDYTLHFDGEKSAILQAHMLEVCPLIAEAKPKLEVHRLAIGIDSETARLVFTSKQGEGVAATIVDLGNRFRLIVNKVECIKEQTAAQTSRCQRIVDSDAEPRSRCCCMDSGRWYSPHQLLLRLDSRILGRLCRNGRYRNGSYR